MPVSPRGFGRMNSTQCVRSRSSLLTNFKLQHLRPPVFSERGDTRLALARTSNRVSGYPIDAEPVVRLHHMYTYFCPCSDNLVQVQTIL